MGRFYVRKDTGVFDDPIFFHTLKVLGRVFGTKFSYNFGILCRTGENYFWNIFINFWNFLETEMNLLENFDDFFEKIYSYRNIKKSKKNYFLHFVKLF